MNIEDAILQMKNTGTYLKDDWISVSIEFENPESLDGYDETSFDIDCSQPNWGKDVIDLWNEFVNENGFKKNSVISVETSEEDKDFVKP